MLLEQIRCVILNTTYEPLSIVPAKRGLILVYEGKASVIESHPTHKIRSARMEWDIPTQVVLNTTVKSRPTFRVPAKLSQRHLFIRDKYTCQYCNRHKSDLKDTEFLTRDHVIPQDKGGRDVWENVVTACSRCNNRKANYTLNQLGLTLAKKPTVPTVFEIWSKTGSKHKSQASLMT